MPTGKPNTGWTASTAHQGGSTYCRSCGEFVTNSPSEKCKSPEHAAYFKHRQEYMKEYYRKRARP